MRDKDFQAGAKKPRITAAPVAGLELEQLIGNVVHAPQAVREKVKSAIRPKSSDTEKFRTSGKSRNKKEPKRGSLKRRHAICREVHSDVGCAARDFLDAGCPGMGH
jgi:hypothetical protein